jgi:hypothetical protein
MQNADLPTTAKQPELPLNHCPALQQEMRTYYDLRWRRWHRAHNFDVAMQDATTQRCLLLAVQHHLNSKRRACK